MRNGYNAARSGRRRSNGENKRDELVERSREVAADDDDDEVGRQGKTDDRRIGTQCPCSRAVTTVVRVGEAERRRRDERWHQHDAEITALAA